MAKAEIEQSSRRRQNRFLVMLLVGAAVISAAKDLGRLQDLTHGVMGIASTVQHTMQAAVRSSSARPGCSQTAAQNDNSAQPFHWNGRVAPQLIEITGQGGDAAPPAADLELKLLTARQANRQADWSDLAAMTPEAPQAEVISITRQRHEDSGRWSTRPRASHRPGNHTATISMRNHDRQFNFTLRVPGVDFVRRAIDNKLRAAILTGKSPSDGACPIRTLRIEAASVNGRMNVLTGYLPVTVSRRSPCQEINPSAEEADCTETIELRTARGTVSLDLLQILMTGTETKTLNSDTMTDFSQMMKAAIQRSVSTAPAEDEDAH